MSDDKKGPLDNLIVDYDEDDLEDAGFEAGPVEVEEAAGKQVESDLPDTEEFDRDQEARRARRGAREEADGPAADGPVAEDDDGYVRQVAEAEERAIMAEARGIATAAQARMQTAQTQLDSTKVALDTISFRLEQARHALAAARDAGNTQGEIDIESAIQEMTTLRSQIEQAQARIPSPQAIAEEAQAQIEHLRGRPRGIDIGTGVKATLPIAERWARANSWLRDPANKPAHDHMLAVADAMAKAGKDPRQPSFYAELGQKVRQAYPHIKVVAAAGTKAKPAARGQVRSPVAPGEAGSGGSARPAPRAQTRYTLSAADITAMRHMHLDPEDPRARKYFAASRMTAAARRKESSR